MLVDDGAPLEFFDRGKLILHHKNGKAEFAMFSTYA